jgi:hypothetical protein
MLVQSVNNVMTVQLVATIVVQSGHQVVQENHLLAVMLVQAETLLVQDQIQDHLVESGLLKDLNVMTERLEESGHQNALSVMTVHLVESGLLKDLLVMIVLQEENGLIQDQLVMSEHLAESGLLRDHSVMTEHLVVNGLLRDQLVMIVLLVVSGLILVQHVKSEVQEILVDQIVWKEMTTVSVHSMVLETSLQTRRLSLKMLF